MNKFAAAFPGRIGRRESATRLEFQRATSCYLFGVISIFKRGQK
jgi:hypothetical protein